MSSIGIGIQTDFYGVFAATISLFDTGGTPIFSGIYNGDSTGSEAGDNLFVGLGDITGPHIGAVVISTRSAGDSTGVYKDDFVINDPSFTYAPIVVPEPSSLVLLGSGLLGMAGLIRRKLDR